MTCKYKCRKCHEEFERDEPGLTKCPKCGHLYVDWLNYVEVLRHLDYDI